MEEKVISPQEQKIKDLEVKVLNLELNEAELLLANSKLGYSTKLMSEFHLTQDDKSRIANSLDLAENTKDVKKIYDEYYKILFNKALGEDTSDFQMSPDFKDNAKAYFAVALGYDPIAQIGDNLSVVAKYFSFENKIRSTSAAGVREPMVDKLMKDRPLVVDAVDNIVNIINSFNKEDS